MIANIKSFFPMAVSGVPWLDAMSDNAKTGYEFSFTRYFYNAHPLQTLEEIGVNSLMLKKETGDFIEPTQREPI